MGEKGNIIKINGEPLTVSEKIQWNKKFRDELYREIQKVKNTDKVVDENKLNNAMAIYDFFQEMVVEDSGDNLYLKTDDIDGTYLCIIYQTYSLDLNCSELKKFIELVNDGISLEIDYKTDIEKIEVDISVSNVFLTVE